MTATFVFIHGSYANSFAWGPLLRELTLHGHRALAVDLPGHGFGATRTTPLDPAAPSSMAGVSLAESAEHVAGVVRRAAAHGPVVAVGHSRGGTTLTALGNAIPGLLHRIVYISAWCCVESSPADYMQGPEYATSALNDVPPHVVIGDPASLGAIRMNWQTTDPETLAALKSSMMADCTDAEFHTFLATLDSDETLDVGTPADRAQAGTWGRIPRTYVRLTADTSIPLALQDRFIEEADVLTPANPFDVRTLDTSHVGFQIHPERAAALLAELV